MTDCVFCDFSKIKDRTVATREGFNLVVTLGQITNGGYLLLIPTKHSSCLGAFNKKQILAFDSILEESVFVLESEYGKNVIYFEHGIVGQTISHAHLHLIPTPLNLTPHVKLHFPNSKIEPVKSFQELRKLYKKRKQPYLFWSTPQQEKLVCWDPPAKPEYFRLLVAELLGVPERGSWRKMDPLLDKKLAEETLDRLIPQFTP